jgi:DNA-directed RNA polymerase I, II, and III subunit RPABC1
MEKNTPFEVYKNLEKLLTYRKITPKSTFLSAEEFAQKLNHYEYVTINGSRGEKGSEIAVIIILIAPNSKYSTRTSDFRKLLKTIDTKKKSEVMFVSDNSLTVHIRKQFAAFKLTATNVYLEEHKYDIFIIEIPKHVGVPPHTIMPDAEIDEFLASHYTNRQNLPKISVNDPMAVWIGLHPGQVVKIDRPSETAGKSIAFRHCIRGG